jgi:hypothetical protein
MVEEEDWGEGEGDGEEEEEVFLFKATGVNEAEAMTVDG